MKREVWELEGRAPSRPLAPVRSLSRVDTDPHAALRALLVGLRPPTPQSPERLRSTPFDCVAIAPCCFAERKAVLSHALAALTALYKCEGQAGREALAAQDAYPVRKQTITEKLSVLTVPAQSKRPECAQFSGRYRFFKCLLSKCAQFSGRYLGHFPFEKKSPLDPLSPWGWFALTY